MNTISSLLTVAEAATGQIEAAMEKDLTAEITCELQERAEVAIALLNNMEAFLKSEALSTPSVIADANDNVERLFGT